jgi:peptidoglycan DL-endopeptidase CwlO
VLVQLRRPTAVVLAVVVAASVAPAAAQEAPGGPSSAQVERRLTTAEDRLAEIEAAASLAVEAVNEAQVELDLAEGELAATLDAADAARGRSDELRVGTDAVARSLYKTGGTNLQFGALLSSDGPTEAGARYATVQRVLRTHRGDVQALAAAMTELRTLEDRLAEQRDTAEARAADLADRRAQLEATLADQADEIASLETELDAARDREEAARRAAAERAAREAAEREAAEREAAEREAAERAARETAEREAAAREVAAPSTRPAPTTSPSAPAASSPAPSSPAPSPQAPSTPSTRGSAQRAVDTALAQVGKPYVWGGGGPNSFDCSGLTSFGWRAAGVSLPHSSRMQYSATTRISRGDLQPGDLVFFGSPIHHVAMYIGGGSVVEASRSGIPVRTSSTALGRSDIAGYGRP